MKPEPESAAVRVEGVVCGRGGAAAETRDGVEAGLAEEVVAVALAAHEAERGGGDGGDQAQGRDL